MYAKLHVIGNVGREPEIKSSGSGVRFAKFPVAVNTVSKGEKTTQWIDVVIFNDKTVDVVEAYVTKGTKVFVEGQPQVRGYMSKSGDAKASLELVVGRFDGRILLLSPKDEGAGERRLDNASEPSHSDGLDDSIPF